MVIGSPRWGVPRIPDTGSQSGPRAESSGHLGCPASRVCYLAVFSGARMDAAGGGFPKNRPCRWRNIAPSPPAYIVARKEPLTSMGWRYGRWLDTALDPGVHMRGLSRARLSRVYPVSNPGEPFLSRRKLSGGLFSI